MARIDSLHRFRQGERQAKYILSFLLNVTGSGQALHAFRVLARDLNDLVEEVSTGGRNSQDDRFELMVFNFLLY